MSRCAFYVAHRQYSTAGQCDNMRAVKSFAWRQAPEDHAKIVPGCPAHRAMAERGQWLDLAIEVRRKEKQDALDRRRAGLLRSGR